MNTSYRLFLHNYDTIELMNAKILVVDDDPAISEMLTLVLQAEGFDTVAVADGAESRGGLPRLSSPI